ncbi:MAG TPA: Gldg family protein [bacterium]|jgi:gliding-associated putative ABC transporter substrate-binding component GldG
MKRKTWSVSSISSLAVVIAIVVVINLIGTRVFTRADLTEKKIYTLSPASRHTVANLSDRLTVKAYFTKNLPPPYNANSEYINDVLRDYKAYSHGKFVYEFVDPANEAKLEEEAQRYRIQPAQVNVMEKDNLQVKKVYMGLVLIYGDKHETIPIIQDVDGFEYDMTSTIKRLVSDHIPKVGFLGGFGTPDLGQDMRNLTTALSKHYDVTPVSTEAGNSMIDNNIDVLCIVQPKEALDDWTKFCIDQYVMHGGKVGWFINKVKADPQTSQASGMNLGIDDMTRGYGFAVGNNLVTDAHAAAITVQQPQGNVMMITQVYYPAFPNITDISKQHPMVKDLQQLTLFFPSSVDTVRPVGAQVQYAPLFSSSDKTRLQVGRYDINPMAQMKREDYVGPKKLLGVAMTGTFQSFFSGKPVPHPKDSTAALPSVSIVTQSPNTRMVVIGDGNFVQGQYAQGGGPNQILFLNAVDWLSQDQDLMSIRSREAAIRPLKPDISDTTKQTVKYANLFVPPALVLMLGLFRWTAKRNRRKGVTL